MIVKIESSDKRESMQVFYISKKNCKAFFEMYCNELIEMQKNKSIFSLLINEENFIATWYETYSINEKKWYVKGKENSYKLSISEVFAEFDVFWQLENRNTMNEMLKKFPELSEDREFETNI